MSSNDPTSSFPDRRTFLKTTGALTAGAALYPYLGCVPREGGVGDAAAAAQAGWSVRPFALDQVSLGESLFREKRDRMLYYARNYGSDTDVLAGPDRLLSIFRDNAGLDTRGADPVGSWENRTGYLRGHYAGHFMSMLAQCWASTGDPVFKEKLDYMVAGLAECQAALAAAAREPTPRVPGRQGTALHLSGSPLGHAEHVRLPAGLLDGVQDFTITLWINPALYDSQDLPDRRGSPEDIIAGSAIFDFGSPNPDYAEPPLAHMALVIRASSEDPGPRFLITTNGREGEESLQAPASLPFGEWTHLAVTRRGSTGTLYLNGEPVAVNDSMTLSPADLGAMEALWLGRRQFPQRNVSYLNAALDEFQIFDRGLSQEEVRQVMESPAEVGEGALAWYRFDEEDGPVAVDSSGNGHDADILAPTDGRRHPGFLSAYPETQFVRLEEFATYGGSQGIWAPYYTLHKIMAGLIDAHGMADNQQALEILTGIGDWVHGRLAPLRQEQLDRMWNIYIAGEYGGVNESLAYLHALMPGKTEYVEAAKCFVNNNVYRPTVADEDILDGRHANQHIPQFTGYLRTYEQGHEEEFLLAARNFWDMVVPHRIYSHGGLGVGEMLSERDVIAGSLFEERNHAETCPLYNMLKLSRNLFFHEPDPKYMDYYELGLFNQMAGSRRDNESATSPEVTYFVPVRPGSQRGYGNTGTCCGGTGMESHTKYQDSIYFRAVDGSALYVNLYIPSTLQWPEKGLTITQETSFPREGASTLTVEGSGPLEIKLRVPSWVRRGFTVAVNGETQDLEATPGTYLSLNRRWSSGDRIQISMPLSFRVEGAIDDPSVQSLYYGPILLAAQAEAVGETLEDGLLEMSFYRHMKLDGDPAAALTPGEEALHFNGEGFGFAPFYVADPVAPDWTPPEPDPDAPQRRRMRAPPTQPYHIYFRHVEPEIVFASVDSGVPNGPGPDGRSFLEALWEGAPFPDHAAFMAAVETLAEAWVGAGSFTDGQRASVVEAARQAQAELES